LKKLAIAVCLGLLMAVVPAAASVQAATPDTADLRVIHGIPGAPPVDVWIDGTAATTGLVQATGFDASLAAGAHSVVVCISPSTSDTCAPGGGAQTVLSENITVTGGTTYALVVEPFIAGPPPPVGVLAQFAADTTPTALGKARFQMNHGANGAPEASICLNGSVVPGITDITYGNSGIAEVAAGTYNLGVSIGGGPCSTPNPINLVAGTSFVLTVTDNGGNESPPCGADCVQVLVVGQGRPANTPAAPAFCKDVLGLGAVSADLKTVLGPIVVGTPSTYPTPAAVMAAVGATNAAIASGDMNVPLEIRPQWEILTAGLRDLTTGLALVGGDVTLLPPEALTAIVDGLNNPPANPSTAAATAVLTSWFTSNCITPAPAAAAATETTPAFTG